LGNKRRNSSATAARLRITDWAVGWVMTALSQGEETLEQNRNNAKMLPPQKGRVCPVHFVALDQSITE
jgi:hypothetical protein